jgi:hypothetical protein
MTTPAELLGQSLAKFRTAKRISGNNNSYRKDNPGEYAKVIAYLDGGARPTGVVTDMGLGLLLAEDARRALLVDPEPEPENPVIPSGTNDAAIRSAITKAQTEGRPLYFPAATYTYTSLLNITGIEVYGDGPTSILVASNPNASAIIMTGAFKIRNLKVTSPNAVSRDNNGACALIQIGTASGWSVQDMTLDKCENTAILNLGGSNGTILRNNVSNTMSDAIHNTNGVHHVTVRGNTVRNSGDDMIAVVSYAGAAGNCHDILVEDNDVANQTSGRGCSVVGGDNITIRNNIIAGTYGAGVYVAAEDSWNSFGCSNVQVLGNTISDTDNGSLGHGGVTVFGRSIHDVSDTLVQGNHLSNTRRGFFVQAYAPGTRIIGNDLTGASEQGVLLAGAENTTIDDNTLTTIATYGVYCEAGSSGSLYIRNNNFTDINTVSAGGVDCIHIAAGSVVSTGVITGNTLATPGNFPFDQMVQNTNGNITVSGNTSS